MPVISMFYGIVVRMYFFDNRQHSMPHIHVEYQGASAVFDITSAERLAGEFPRNKERLVVAWIELHRDELLADWNLAIHGEELFRIAPLS